MGNAPAWVAKHSGRFLFSYASWSSSSCMQSRRLQMISSSNLGDSWKVQVGRFPGVQESKPLALTINSHRTPATYT